MATTVFYSIRTPIVSSATPSNRRSLRSPAATQSNGWWAPLFGWSPEPDYINGGVKIEADHVPVQSERESGRIGPDRGIVRGCFTEEKAKEMRRKTVESSTFHDVMYHSAIASRLASDLSGH